jgi:hypothetical protein
MFDLEATFDRRLLERQPDRPTVIFTEALDPRVLEAVSGLARFCRPVLLAPEDAVRDVAARELSHLDAGRVEFALSESAFVDPGTRDDLVDEFVRFL